MISILLVRKIAQLFLIMILGYLLVKLRILKTEESIVLSKLSLYLVMPAVILITFLATVTPAASTVTQFAQVHDKNAAYAGAINIMTTLLCIVTMPIFVILYYI